jgi:hypothetical protein
MAIRITDFVRFSQRFLYWRDEANKAEARRLEARDWLKDYMQEHAEPDENGSFHLYFEDPFAVGNSKFSGLELRKSQPKDRLDTDVAKAYVEEHGLADQVIKMVPTYDWDELMVLNQQGKIPDDALDAMFITPDPVFSLYPIEE